MLLKISVYLVWLTLVAGHETGTGLFKRLNSPKRIAVVGGGVAKVCRRQLLRQAVAMQ